MELRVLRYFLAVVEEGSILSASEVLHISQPSLSRQLAQLEAELKTMLFLRGNRKITLTEAGILFKRRAEEIVSLTDKTEQEMYDFTSGKELSGVISIGSGEVSSMDQLAKLMAEFSSLHPLVRFSFYSGNADDIKEQLDKGLLDFGLLLEPVNFDKYDSFPFGVEEAWVSLMRSDSPLTEKEYVTAKDLKDQKLIFPDRQVVQDQLKRWFGPYYNEKNVIVTKNLMNNAAMMVKNGLGYAFGVEFGPALYDPAKFCYRKLYPTITTHSRLVWKKFTPFSSAATSFLDFLRISKEHN